MRACAQISFPLVWVFAAGLGLAGCATVDELKDTMSGWFTTGKSMVGEDALPGDVPDPKDKAPPEKMAREQARKAPKNKDKQAGKQQRNQAVELANKPSTTVSAEARKPKRAEAESASSLAAPTRLPTLWPDAPPPGAFAR
jgi:hypothetical protein